MFLQLILKHRTCRRERVYFPQFLKGLVKILSCSGAKVSSGSVFVYARDLCFFLLFLRVASIEICLRVCLKPFSLLFTSRSLPLPSICLTFLPPVFLSFFPISMFFFTSHSPSPSFLFVYLRLPYSLSLSLPNHSPPPRLSLHKHNNSDREGWGLISS